MADFSLVDSQEADAIAGAMPEVQEHAVAQHENATAEAEAQIEKDSDGVAFDSKIHTGSKLKSGQWRKRKAGSVVAQPSKKKGAKDPAPTPSADESQARAAGVVAAGTIFMFCRGIMGDEWTPTNDEVTMQNEAWGNYFVAKGIKDIPPGAALLMAIGAYAGPRFTKPKTQAKVSAAKAWIVLRIAKWKIKRALKQQGIAADVTIKDGEIFIDGSRADSWNDGIRENDEGSKSRR